MRKALLAVVLAVLLLTSTAVAEVFEGVTVAAVSVPIEATTGGRLIALHTVVGSSVRAGDVIGAIRTTRVFASQDGTIARICADEGDVVEGTVLEISPIERYKIYCSVEKAYQSTDSTLVHSGEQVYFKCTNDGTHRGIGCITEINGNEFMTLTVGGELYVGETVYLFRDAEFTKTQRIGIGTVAANETELYEAQGKLVRLHVSEGEYVERGELLYEMLEAEGKELTSPVNGIVTDVAVEQGAVIEKGQNLITVVPLDQICVEVLVDEAALAEMSIGEQVELIFAADRNEETTMGRISAVSYVAQDKTYAVRIQPQNTQGLRLGMTVSVRTGSD